MACITCKCKHVSHGQNGCKNQVRIPEEGEEVAYPYTEYCVYCGSFHAPAKRTKKKKKAKIAS
jgi:hypothetical protein